MDQQSFLELNQVIRHVQAQLKAKEKKKQERVVASASISSPPPPPSSASSASFAELEAHRRKEQSKDQLSELESELRARDQGFFDAIVKAAKSVANKVVNVMKNTVNMAKTAIGNAVNTVKNVVSKVKNKISSVLSNPLGKIKNLLSKNPILNRVKNFITNPKAIVATSIMGAILAPKIIVPLPPYVRPNVFIDNSIVSHEPSPPMFGQDDNPTPVCERPENKGCCFACYYNYQDIDSVNIRQQLLQKQAPQLSAQPPNPSQSPSVTSTPPLVPAPPMTPAPPLQPTSPTAHAPQDTQATDTTTTTSTPNTAESQALAATTDGTSSNPNTQAGNPSSTV